LSARQQLTWEFSLLPSSLYLQCVHTI